MALVRRSPDFVEERGGVARSIDQWNQLMVLLETRLAQTGAYVTGADFTLADIRPSRVPPAIAVPLGRNRVARSADTIG